MTAKKKKWKITVRERLRREAERSLSLSFESTVNNSGNYQLKQKKGGEGAGDAKEGGSMARKAERERRRVNIAALCQANTGMLGYFNKKPPFIEQRKGPEEQREEERKRESTGARPSRDKSGGKKLGNGK